jgi:cell division protein FtsQ
MAKKRTRPNRKKKRSAERLRRLKQRAWTLLLAAGAVAVLLLVSALFVFTHDMLMKANAFPVQQIGVTGSGRLSKAAVVRRAGVERGDNILSVNLSKIKKRLTSHPWIADAEVRREIPGGLQIRIREHRCDAIVDLGDKFLLNRGGRLFKSYQPGADPEGLPVIRGLAAADVVVAPGQEARSGAGWPRSAQATDWGGAPPPGPVAAVMEVLKLGRSADSTVPNRRIGRIDVDRSMGLTLHAFNGTKVIHIGYGDYPEKYRMLATILARVKRDRRVPDFSRIDLQDINRIVIRPVKQNPSG